MGEDRIEDQEFFYSEIKNPIYKALENQLRLEFEWALAEEDLYSLSWIALHQKELPRNAFAKIRTLVMKNLKRFSEDKITSFITTEFILGLCFSLRLFHEKKIKFPPELPSILKTLLEETKRREWLRNHEFVSLIVRSISGVRGFESLKEEAVAWLRERYKQFLYEHNYEGIVDCLFGLEVESNSQPDISLLQELLEHVTSLSDANVAKLCILLENKNFIAKFLKELERRLEINFKSYLNSSLQRGLKEIISLLNSGCPSEVIKLMLDKKRKEGQDWANQIKIDDKNIIIEHIPNIDELPTIDPKFHALAFKVLEIYNRSLLIMLNKNDFLKLEEAFNVNKKGYIGIRKTEYHIILLISGIISFLALMFLPDIFSKIWNINYLTILSLFENIGTNWFLLLKIGSVPLLLFLTWVWFIRVLYRLRRGGKLSVMELIWLMPILGSLIQKILGQKEEK